MVLIGRPKGETCYFEASYGFSREFAEFAASHPFGLDAGTVSGRVLLQRKIVHVPDVLADPEYTYGAGQKSGARTLLAVPLLREGSPIGVIALGRNSVRPFTDRQIELVTTFADQAVIAIENVRLFDEVRQRTTDLREAHDRVKAQAADLETWNRTLEQRVAEQVAEIERVGRLKSFLPPQIAQLVVSAGHESVGELALKGFSRPVKAFNVCNLRSQQS